MKHLLPAVVLCSLAFAAEAWAGQFNAVFNIGDPAPAWTDLPGTDGQKHSLADLKGKDVVVVAFTCNSCPYAVDYEDRLIKFAKERTTPDSSVALVAINVNKIEQDSLAAMTERAKSKGFNFPYLYDDTQQIALTFGATRTPEFFVLDKQRKVVYMGAFDDSANAAAVKVRYLEDAVAAALRGEKAKTTETPPVGCNIRYARVRPKK